MSDLLYVALLAVVFGLDQGGKSKSRKKYRKRYLVPSKNEAEIGKDLQSKEYYWAGESEDAGKDDRENCTLCHLVKFHYLENRGAMLNFGDQHSLVIRIVSVGLTAVLLAVYILTLGHAGKDLLKTGLSLLLGGAFSNTYDRLKDGFVTDYLSFRFGPKVLQNVVFNIGDFAIIIGALLVVLEN